MQEGSKASNCNGPWDLYPEIWPLAFGILNFFGVLALAKVGNNWKQIAHKTIDYQHQCAQQKLQPEAGKCPVGATGL
jgi:hypothetical protein